MGNLFGSLKSTASAMHVFERALSATQSNVVNVNTAGYAKQRQGFEADRFEPDRNIVGGVSAGPLYNYRDAFAERNVQTRSSRASLEEQRTNSLSNIESLFPVKDGAGIPAAINKFFNSVSQLTVSPNDSSGRQTVLERASDVATSFQRTATQIQEIRGNAQTTLRTTVDEINSIGARIQDLNVARRAGGGDSVDPGSDAKLYAALEDLSKLVNFQAVESKESGVTVTIGGQSLLVIGDRRYPISTDVLADQARIVDSDGLDITRQVTGGKTAGLVDVYNNKIPAYLDDLNTLAGNFGDQVNQTLAQGVDLNGNAPTQDLFTYNSALGSAYTFQVNGITGDQLALAGSGQPGGNGNAIALTKLAEQRVIRNQTFQQFYGSAAGRVGRDLASSKTVGEVQGDLLGQAKELRATVQGVSLDEEASLLIQYQRSYQAAAQLFKTINEMTDTIMSVIR